MSVTEDCLSTRDYERLCELIYREAGISLGAGKQVMLEGRVKRRLKVHSIDSFASYCTFLFSSAGLHDEIPHLIDVVTTNKTDFFREPRHFNFLTAQALPDLVAKVATGTPIRIWSAGCSSGEEPYTLAIVLSEYAQSNRAFRFRILATDISTTVLSRADRGVYPKEVIAPVPSPLRRKYFLCSRDRTSNLVRVTPELRRHVEFRRLNFMDPDYGVEPNLHCIFCRNVIIYFDRPTQERILGRLAEHLVPGGYLFVGHAETLHDMRLPLQPVAPALYRKVHLHG